MRALLLLLTFLPMVAIAAQPRKRPADHVRGKEIWERSCWQCHGKDASGNGPAAADLLVPVPDLRGNLDGNRQKEMVDAILNGRSTMPAFSEELDIYDVRKILVYLRRLEQKDSESPKSVATPPAEPDSPSRPAPPAAQEN